MHLSALASELDFLVECYRFLNSKQIKTNEELLYFTFMLLFFFWEGSLVCLPVVCVCTRVHVCARAACQGAAAGEPNCHSTHLSRSMSLEISKADPFFLAILLIEPSVPTPEMQGQSFQRGEHLAPLSRTQPTLNRLIKLLKG